MIRDAIEANLDYFHTQRWAIQPAQLRCTIEDAADGQKADAEYAPEQHYDIRDQPETSHAALIRDAMADVESFGRV